MGVSGCGKSTVAGLLAAHSVGPRRGGRAASVRERHEDAVRDRIDRRRSPSLVGENRRLDRRTRRVGTRWRGHLLGAQTQLPRPAPRRQRRVVFVYLRGAKELIAQRLAVRHGHYMPAALLDSQFADLEPPGADESAITVDIGPPALEIVRRVLQVIGTDTPAMRRSRCRRSRRARGKRRRHRRGTRL